MFGVVPKPLWEKTNPADSKNRIEMSARCLLIEDGDKLILVDAGLGDKQSEKFFSHYSRSSDASLLSSLNSVGFSPNDITDVLFTHLHLIIVAEPPRERAIKLFLFFQTLVFFVLKVIGSGQPLVPTQEKRLLFYRKTLCLLWSLVS